MFKNNFAQTGRLLGLNLRRDWLKLTLWLLGLVGLMVGYAAAIGTIFPDEAARESLIATLKTPAMVAFLGYFPEHVAMTDAVMFSGEMLVFMSLMYGLASLLIAISATRGEEEAGLVELLQAKNVGRHAFLLAGFWEVLLFNLATLLLVGGGLSVIHMTGANLSGDWLTATLPAAFGLLFGVVGLLLAQVVAETRSAMAGSLALLGLAYLVRMLVDVSQPSANWWSPFGWLERAGAYYQNNWWPLGLLVLSSVVLFAGAFWASDARDLGAGLVAVRNGRVKSRLLRGPLTALIKTDGRSFWSWLIGALIIGLMYGSIFNTLADMIDSNPMIKQILGSQTRQQAGNQVVVTFMATLSIVLVTIAVIRALFLTNRLYGDGQLGYIELFAAKPIGHIRLGATYLGYALINGWLTLGAGVFGLYLGNVAVLSQPVAAKYFWRMFGANSVVVLVFIAVAAVLLAFAPKWRHLLLAYAGIGFVLMYFRNIFQLSDQVVKIVPYGWFKNIPQQSLDWSVLGVMIGLSVVLLIIASWGYHRRDQIFN
ncbi:ABC transporter permease [Lapidilactobacillus salsurivasis]